MRLKKCFIGMLCVLGVLVAFCVAPASVAFAQAEVTGHGDAHVDSAADGAAHASESHAAEGHGDDAHAGDAHGGGDVNPVKLDPDLAIVTAAIFLLLMSVLWKFAWSPIVTALDQREHSVAEQIAEAKRSQEAARQLLADHEQKLAGAAAEVKAMLDEARKDAEHQKQQILDTAQAAAAAEKDRAVREIHAAKNAALQDLAKKSVDTAVDLAGKIVRRQLSSNDHVELIGDALQSFSNDN
ncbi:MAG: F0F1 ATP synthase subunit B [Planctomycetales bacterium]|nr:F0F1 ATP synthase subunit B [Planctomycetales bacterium]